MSTKIVFITATDTGVGKTLLTALLLCYLRQSGARALALKPFCSGGRADAETLHRLQKGELTLDEINPFYFPEPVAPLVSARRHKRVVSLDQVVQHIHSIAARVALISRPASAPNAQNYLLIEGSGGLLVPLGEGYTVRDLIARLACSVLVVSRNRLGTINHTLLTTQALLNRSPLRTSPRRSGAKAGPHSALSRVVLMDSCLPDVSSASNAAILRELLAPTPLILVPFLGAGACRVAMVRKQASRLRALLTRIIG
jgi:dethiobiotin synthetase